MGHGHEGDRSASKRALRISLGFTVAYGVVQIVTGVWFHSLALIADAVHNVSDGGAIALALAAAWAAGLPARGAHTFGGGGGEPRSCGIGQWLVVISGWILTRPTHASRTRLRWSAWACSWSDWWKSSRNGIPVILMVRAGSRHDLNLRGALVHAATDVLGRPAPPWPV